MDSTILVVIILGAVVFLAMNKKGSKTFVPKTIVCIGDSATSHGVPGNTDNVICPWAQLWPNLLGARTGHNVIPKGHGGDTSAQILARFESDVLANNAQVCIMEEGGNDILNSVPAETTMANLAALVNLCKQHNIIPIIMCQGSYHESSYFMNVIHPNYFDAYSPRPTDEWEQEQYAIGLRRLQKEYCEANGIKHIDVYTPSLLSPGVTDLSLHYTDRIHWNVEGNAKIYEVVLRELSSIGIV